MHFTNRILILVANFLLTTISFSQSIDSLDIEGVKHYVYPFRVPFNSHSAYRKAVDMNEVISFAFQNYKKELKKEMGEDLNSKEFKKLLRSMERFETNEKEYKKKKLKKAIQRNPYPLLDPQYSFSQDIVPSLDPIPDGPYIQYFEPYCIATSNGECENSGDRIAGRFTILNGMLQGEAVWYNLVGDTLKYGHFEQGVKTGEWFLQRSKPMRYSLDYEDIDQYILKGYPKMDTVTEVVAFVNGAKHGHYLYYNNSMNPIKEGRFTNGVESGYWVERSPEPVRRRSSELKWNNDKITKSYTINNSDQDTSTVKLIWIRNGLIGYYPLGYPDFNFNSRYELPDLPSDLLSPSFEITPDLDLDEEMINSYDDSRYEADYDYEYNMDYEFTGLQKRYYDPKLEYYRTRGEINDSIGMRKNYVGVYEIRYPNGQLAVKWDLAASKDFIDDTIFWDNGVPHDIVAFDSDSNHFRREMFDYDGKLFKRVLYDSIGDYLRVDYEFDSRKVLWIDGYKVYEPDYSGNYEYYQYDTLEHKLIEPTVLYRSWSSRDTSLISNETYYPDSRELYSVTRSMLGNRRNSSRLTFAENFESWTGKDTLMAGSLKLVSTNSGTLYEGWELDSILQMNVSYAYERFDITSDFQLLKNDVPYSGPFELDYYGSKFDISKKDLLIELPKHKRNTTRKRFKKIGKFISKGKVWDELIQSCLTTSESDLSFAPFFFGAFFDRPLSGTFASFDDLYGYGDYGMNYGGDSKDNLHKLVGYMHNGKPQGEWVSYDGNGKVITKANFLNGELDGKVFNYTYAYPESEEMYDMYYYESPIQDTFPPKKTYYLSSEIDYKNGMIDGKYVEYNWLGEIVQESTFKEDFRHGSAVERNKLAYTVMNYEDGVLDGYLQTYLTVTPNDTILLYDLNFQNGLLQGESKAYHLNGNLAKRGFFLNGEPIEDYEAYDSLGFKYHYVKFMYSFPIEEKIWEENELSVKYNFDWRDSIYFEPSDITSSQSLESMLFDLGFGADYLERPYYGRPSLVNKSGIEYEMTKYYPNDQIARHGFISDGRKTNCWTYYNYDGAFLYEVDYFDSIVVLNDSIRFKIKGILTDYDDQTKVPLYKAYIIEKFEKYDCSHSDHYEIRQLWTIEDYSESKERLNGYVINYYDNGTIQSEGNMVNGLPSGFWKIYDPFGKLNQYGQYVQGKRNGRWLSGDLSKTKYLGDICLNPNLPDFEDEVAYRENLLNVTITTYKLGKSTSSQFYDINMNRFIDNENEEDEVSED